MKRGVGVTLLILILVSLSVFAVTQTSEVGLPQNTARIFDFTNDGFNDALAFSDRIDNRLLLPNNIPTRIKLYTQQGTGFSFSKDLTTQALKHCAVSYQDSNKNGYIDIFYSCLNATNEVVSELLLYNGTDYTGQQFTTNTTFAAQSYGDVLFFDFTNNGYPDIISCFLTDNGNLTFYQNNEGSFTNTTSPIPLSQFKTNTNQISCYLTPADLTGNGYLDIIAYTYDANNFSVYLNELGTLTEGDPNDFFNASFFETTKIKALQAFDNEGFSDLYYVVDLNTNTSTRTIEFGYFENKQANETNISITSPSFTIDYIGTHNPSDIDYSWETQTGGFFTLNITNTSTLVVNDIETPAAITYNLAINGSNYIYGDFFNNSYDYNTGRGSLLYRTSTNLSLPNIGFTARVQGIGPSGLISNSSDAILYRPSYTYNSSFAAAGRTFFPEFCDGRDTNLDGIVDGGFTMIWPDNTTQNLTFTTENGCHRLNNGNSYNFTHNNYEIIISCPEELVCPPEEIITETPSSVTTSSPETDSGTVENEGTTTDEDIPDTPAEPQTQTMPVSEQPFEQFFTITYRNNRTFVEEEIKNIRRTRMNSAIVRKEFNKDILENASLLQSINTFLIIRENPIVEFELGPMDYLESRFLTYSLPGTIDKQEIRNVRTNYRANQEFTDEQIAEIEAQQEQKAAESIETRYREATIDNQTFLTVELDLQEGVEVAYDVEVEQFIPKCLLEEITETILEAGIDQSLLNSVEIKEADPIIVWNFKEVRAGQELTLRLDAFREEDCDDEVLIRTLTRDYIQSSYEVNQDNLRQALLLTGITILILLLMFVAATRDLAKHKEPHIDRLVKAILHQTHRNVPKNTIIQNLKNNKETDEDIKEAFRHIDQLHAFKKHKLTHTVTERGVEIIFFILLLILNLAEFTGLLPGYLDWIKKLISWALLLTILYKADLTKILFNISLPKINITILVAMLLMHLKNIIAFAETQSLERQTIFIFDLYAVILNNRIFFNETLFFIGAAILLIPTIYLGFKIQPREGSLYYVLSKTHTHNIIQKLARTSGIYILLLLFFFTIFDRIMEWLAVSIDAAVFILGLIILLTLFAGTTFLNKHKEEKNIFQVLEHKVAKHLSLIILGAFFFLSIFKPFMPETAATITFAWLIGILVAVIMYAIITNIRQHFSGLRHISTAIETIYLKFVRLFKYPGTLFLGISGLFILQQIVEIGLFIIPNITGKPTTLYDTHIKETLFTLFTNDSILARHLFQLTLQEQIIYGALYVISIIGFFMLFFIPIYIWAMYFKHRAKHPTNLSLPEIFKNKFLAIVAIPTIIVALLTDVLNFRYLDNLGAIGIFIEAGQVTLDYTYALILVGAVVVYLCIIPFIESHKIRVYTTAWISIGTLCVFYLAPFVNSLTAYITDLLTSVQIPLTASDGLIILIALFLILDILLIYVAGLAIMLFLMLPVPAKKLLIRGLSHVPFFHRLLFLASDVHHLEYYDDSKEHVSGNLVHHLEKYVKDEIELGHHVETIIYQLKLHGYPEHIIQEVIKDLAHHPKFIHEVEHIHAKNVRVEEVAHLVPKVKKLTKKYSAQEIYEMLEDKYKYYEIKLAIRLSTKELKKNIAIEIEQEEMKHIHVLAKWMHDAFMHKKTRQEIIDALITKGWDLELITKIIDNPKFREKEFDIEKSKALRNKKKITEKELMEYSYPELVYAKVKVPKKIHEKKKKLYLAPYESIAKDIEAHYLKIK